MTPALARLKSLLTPQGGLTKPTKDPATPPSVSFVSDPWGAEKSKSTQHPQDDPLAAVDRWPLHRRREWAALTLELQALGWELAEAEVEAARRLREGGQP